MDFKKSLTKIVLSAALAIGLALPFVPNGEAVAHSQDQFSQHEVCSEHELCGYGVGFPNNPFYHRYLPRQEMYHMIDEYMDAASKVADWIRLELILYDGHTKEYVFNWWDYAYLVESAHKKGLDVVFLLDEQTIKYNTPDLDAPLDENYTNPAIDEFLITAHLIGMLFDGNPFPAVEHYQIMNEPDVKNTNPDAIAKILSESCSVLDGRHIIGPGMQSRNAMNYLQQVYDSEAFEGEPCFDLAVHVYDFPDVSSDLDSMLDFASQHGQNVIVSEFGQMSDGSMDKEREQVRYFFDMEDLFVSKDIKAYCVFTLEESDFTDGYGIFSLENGFNTLGRVMSLSNGRNPP